MQLDCVLNCDLRTTLVVEQYVLQLIMHYGSSVTTNILKAMKHGRRLTTHILDNLRLMRLRRLGGPICIRISLVIFG